MADVETLIELCDGDMLLYLNPTYPTLQCVFIHQEASKVTSFEGRAE